MTTQGRESFGAQTGAESVAVMMNAIHTANHAIAHGAPPSLIRKLTPYLLTAAFILSGCKGIETSRISSMSGGLSGVDEAGARTGLIYRDDYTYTTIYDQALALAQEAGFDEREAAQEVRLKSPHTESIVTVLEGNVTASVTQTNAGTIGPQANMNLEVIGQQDGKWTVQISSRDCTIVDQVCSQPVTSQVSGTFDNTSPNANIAIGADPNGGGLLITGNAVDGPNGSGIQGIDVLSCTTNSPIPIQINADGSFSTVTPPVMNDNCYYVLARDAVGFTSARTEGSTSTFKYQISADEQIVQMPDGKYKVISNGSTNLYPPSTISIERCDTNGCVDLTQTVGVQSQLPGHIETNEFPPAAVGTTTITTKTTDKWGNQAPSVPQYIQYNFSVGGNAVAESNGTISISAASLDSNTPNVTITVNECDKPGQTIAMNPGTNGSGSLTGVRPSTVGELCYDVTATDGNGVPTTSKITGNYGLSATELDFHTQVQNGGVPDKAKVFFYGNPPDKINTSSIVIHCTQPDWKDWNNKKEFMGQNVGPVVINGETWKVGIVMPDMQDVGDAVCRVDFQDVNGFMFSSFYPLHEVPINLKKDHPNFGQLIGFLFPQIAGTTLAFMYTSGMYRAGRKKTLRAMAEDFGGKIVRGKGRKNIEILKKNKLTKKIYLLNKDEIGIFDTVFNIWGAAQEGKLAEALERLQSIDFRASPELYKINLSVLNGMMDMIEQRLNGLIAGRNILHLQSPEISRLFTVVRNMAALHDEWVKKVEAEAISPKKTLEPIWGLLDSARSYKILDTISGLQMMEDAYTHAQGGRMEFIKLYHGIFNKDEKSLENFRRAVQMMCDWGNFQMANELIKEANKRMHPLSQELGLYYSTLLAQERIHYLVGLPNSIAEDLKITSGKPKHLRDFSRGKRFPREFEDQLYTIGRIFYDTLTLDFQGVLQNSERLFELYGDSDFILIEPLLASAVEGIYRNVEEVIGLHDINSLTKAVMSPVGYLSTLNNKAKWMKNIKITHRERLFEALDEIMLIYAANTTPFEGFERTIGPHRMQSPSQLSSLISLFVKWGDYATAQACIDAYPIAKDKIAIQAQLNTHYSTGIKSQIINEMRGRGITMEQLRRKYRIPKDQQSVFENLLYIEREAKAGKLQNVFVFCDTLSKTGNYNAEIMGDSVNYSLSLAYDLLRKIRDEKARTSFEKDDLYTLATYLQTSGNKPWFSQSQYTKLHNLSACADEIAIVGMAQKERSQFMKLIQKSSIQLPKQINILTNMLSSWGDYELAYQVIEGFAPAKDKASTLAQFDASYLQPIRKRYLSLIREHKREGVVQLLKAAQYPPSLLQEFQIVNTLVSAVEKDDINQSFLASYKLMQANPSQYGFVGEMLDGIMGKMAHEMDEAIQSHDLAMVGSRKFAEYRKAVQVVENEQWFTQAIQSHNKKRVLSALAEVELIGMAINRQKDAYVYYLDTHDSHIEYFAQKLVDWGQFEALELASHDAKKETVRAATYDLYEKGILRVQHSVIDELIMGTEPTSAIEGALRMYNLPLAIRASFNKLRDTDGAIKNTLSEVERIYGGSKMAMAADARPEIVGMRNGSNKDILYAAYKLSPTKARFFLNAIVALYKSPKTLALGTDEFKWTPTGIKIGKVQDKIPAKLLRRVHPDTSSSVTKNMASRHEREAYLLFAKMAFGRLGELKDDKKVAVELNTKIDKLLLKKEPVFRIFESIIKLVLPGYIPSVENGLILALCEAMEAEFVK